MGGCKIYTSSIYSGKPAAFPSFYFLPCLSFSFTVLSLSLALSSPIVTFVSPSNSYIPPPLFLLLQIKNIVPMAQEEKWEPFADVVDDDDDGDDDDEALSLSDLPDNLSDNNNNNTTTCNPHTHDAPDNPTTDFEFRVSFGGGGDATTSAAASAADMFAADMCAADEVFFRGQLLPLRPSLSSSSSSSCSSSSESALFRYGSLSDSFDRSASSTGLSSRSSSGCVSRSPSSNSGSARAGAGLGDAAPPRLSASANYLLYALPSPSPQIRRKGGAGAAPARRSTSSHGPGIFRLGVARAPDIIELRDLRMRSRSRSHADPARDGKKSLGSSSSNNNYNSIGGSFRLLFPGNGDGRRGNEQKVDGRRRSTSFMGRGFGCSCAPDAVEPASLTPIAASSLRKKAMAAASPPKKKEEEEEERRGLKRGESMCRRRIMEWLEELSIGKVVVG